MRSRIERDAARPGWRRVVAHRGGYCCIDEALGRVPWRWPRCRACAVYEKSGEE
jgi:hypothetical protein